MEQAKKRDRKIYITDIAIERVGRVQLSDFSEEQILTMQERHKALLKIAKDKNDSNEVLMICDSKFEKQVVVLGTEHTVTPGSDPNAVSLVANSPPHSLVYMHNHPSTNTFSAADIDTFVCDRAIKAMSVVTNQGEVYVINKTAGYDFENTRNLLMDIYKSLPEGANKSNRFVKEFLKRCKEGGVEYGK